MSPVRLIILVVAAAAAIGAVFVVRSMQSPAPAQAAAAAAKAAAAKQEQAPAKQLLVARHAIPIGKFVVADDLKWQSWPDNSPTGAFIDQKGNPDALDKMIGAVARFELVEGEPVTGTKLVHPGEGGFMAAMMAPGMRAASIEISAETAAGGFILPNDHVDVILTRELENKSSDGPSKPVRSDLILSNVRVLAIDGIYGPPAEGGQGAVLVGTRATLELSDKDTTLLNAAKKAGEVALSLRSITDLQGPSGATPIGRAYRDGVSQTGGSGIRIYRYGNVAPAPSPAG